MRCEYALLFSLAAAPLHLTRAEGTGASPDNGKPVPVVNAPGYYYLMAKSATRARILQNRMAARAQALRREKAATNAAPAQEFVPNPPNAPGASAAPPVQAPVPNTAAGFVPRYPIATNHLRVVAAPVRGGTNSPAVNPAPAAARERTLPIVETSGPEYNDRDPLLGYQLQEAGKGNPESEYAVGIRYLTGNGLKQDPQLGREWLEKSSAHGNLRARAKLRELKNAKNS